MSKSYEELTAGFLKSWAIDNQEVDSDRSYAVASLRHTLLFVEGVPVDNVNRACNAAALIANDFFAGVDRGPR